MLESKYMVENAEGGPTNNIRYLVESALSEGINSYEPVTKHDAILQESERVREKIRGAANQAGKDGNEFDKGMYLAAYLLNSAVSYLLDEPTAISVFDPETGGFDNKESTGGREDFVRKISRALTHLGMDGKAVHQALIKSGDVNE
jgi:hypothetical protein